MSDGARGPSNAHRVVKTGRPSDQVQSSYFVQSLGRTSVKTVTNHTGVVAMESTREKGKVHVKITQQQHGYVLTSSLPQWKECFLLWRFLLE